jgi:hypothetical protein
MKYNYNFIKNKINKPLIFIISLINLILILRDKTCLSMAYTALVFKNHIQALNL